MNQIGKINRIDSVDSIRLLAIIGVIVAHTNPFLYESYENNNLYRLSLLINQLARFSVPFFFVISGYFWGLKIRNGKNPLTTTNDMGLRILTIFVAWSFIYLLPYNISAFYEFGILGPIKAAYWNLSYLLKDPSNMLFEGTRAHLWFLVALLFALYITCLFINFNAGKSLLFVSLILYVAGVLLKAYADTPIGFSIEFNTRNGPFFSTFLFASGYFLAAYQPNQKWFYYGLAVLIVGTLLHFIEIYSLMKLFGSTMWQDFVFSTYLMGMGAAMLSLSNHAVLRIKVLSNIGKMVLGIYAVHFMFVDILRPIDKVLDNVFWEVGLVALVLALSIISTHLMSKSPILRRIVS